jgi:hypothetical protein
MRPIALLLLATLACDEPAATPAPAPAPPTPAPSVATPEPPALEALSSTTRGEAVIALPPDYVVAPWRASFGHDDDRGLVVLSKGEGDSVPKVRLVVYGPLAAGTYPVVIEAARGSRTGVVSIALDHQPTLRVLGGEVVITRADPETLVGTLDLELRDAMTPSANARLRASFQAAHDRFYDAQLDHERAIREQLKRR